MEDFSQEIIAAAQDMIYVKDEQFRYLYLNQRALEIFGVCEDEIIGKTSDEIFPHTDCVTIRRDEKKVLAGKTVSAQIEIVHFEKSIYLDVIKYPLYRDGVTLICAIARDITRRRWEEYELKVTQKRWEFALEGSGDGVWDWNAKTDETNFSPRILEMLGFSKGEWVSDLLEWERLLHPDDRDWVLRQDALQREGLMTSFSDEYRMQCKDGDYKWILDRGKVIEWDYDGKPLRIIGTHTDITHRKELEKELRLNEERFRAFVESNRDIFWEADASFHFTYISPQIERILQFSPDDFLNKTPGDMLPRQDDADKFFAAMQQGEFSPDVVRARRWMMRRKDGSDVFIEVDGEATFDATGKITGFRGIARDITEQLRAEEALRFMAYHDPLTGLPNRKLFMEMTDREKKRSERHKQGFAILFCDIDNFKAINDTHGHDKGDVALCEFARRATEVLRGSDVISRLGGDEFTVLLTEIDSYKAAEKAVDKLINAISEASLGGGESNPLTISYGIALYPKDGHDFPSLLRAADERMFFHKKRKRSSHEGMEADSELSVGGN